MAVQKASGPRRARLAENRRRSTAARGSRPAVSAAAAQNGVQPRAQIAEIQRSRLLAGAVRTFEELGYARATVAHITARARVSRRTFYELFASRDECLAALIDDLEARVQAEITAQEAEGCSWCERMRVGLGVILASLDREPALARVCIVQASHGGSAVLERRERILAALAGVVDEGRFEHARGAQLSQLTAEGLVGAAFTVVHARLSRREREPLAALRSELMGLIVLPYLGAGAARREQLRAVQAPALSPLAGSCATAGVGGDPLEGVPMRLTYRTTRVLEAVATHPQASNRLIAQHAGITDQGQVSKLLARLQRLGLLAKLSEGHLKGEPNAWTLTAHGQQIAGRIRIHATSQRAAAK